MIKLEKICKSYGENKVLEDFSFHFKKGEKYYINSASGQGKTTLLRIIMNLEQPDHGNVYVNGNLSVVFQEDRLIENISVLKNIEFATKNNETLKKIELFGLKGFENAPISSLSGGMKRRVAILRGMLYNHDVLLLDEPFRGLDDEIKNIVIKEIKALKSTVIITTHIKDEIEKMEIINQINL
ncbi:MAG: ATP-binding cassette domain-containing protein [Clostridia bacterium]